MERSNRELSDLDQMAITRYSRRAILKRGIALGLSAPAIAGLIAACGEDDDEAGDAAEPSPDEEEEEPGQQEDETEEESEDETEEEEAESDEEASGQAKVFRWNFIQDYAGDQLDINKGYTIHAPNLFVGLTRFNLENEVTPAAATEWDVSDDGLVVTFQLRDDMHWSDGTPLTAHDFEYGWKRTLDPETQSIRSWMLYPIEGAEEFYQGDGAREDVGVSAPDDHTLEVRLVAPAAFFPAYIAANNVYYSVPRHVIEEHGDDWVQLENLVYSGPFVVAEHRPESLVAFEPNPEWVLEQPKIDRAEYHVVPEQATALAQYQGDELELAHNIPLGEIDLVRDDPELQEEFFIQSAARVMTLQVNVTRAPVDDVLVRQAFLHATNQRALVEGPFREVLDPALGLRPPGMPGDDFQPLEDAFDPDRARELLAEAGYPDGEGFEPITILVRNEQTSQIAAEFLQNEYSQILNIPVEVEVQEAGAFLDLVQAGEGWIWLSAIFSLSPDLYDLFNVAEGAASGNSQWEDEHFSDLLREAAAESDPDQRMELYDEAELYLVEENAVMIPLWVTDAPSLVKPYVSGVKEDQRAYWLFTYEYIDIERTD